ncbi:hypothetical protein ABB37_07252 [Leptomonas pyrrhocoris]|uniref:LRAT domain-containing protein n=1 Tax=Leptomonas pyrrhocoris TaxID=157538 RepID=A0A0M9FWH3_LEPPY|nr:hypothetical protein ABB37_07252 [Leptomonas pyrrhocoris]KPA77389.1 hypothetical protein ABB37_07252 [Leptomonas pyrrhocoris]|eukprot:XP_015655828.1 hypothetical protein ABB37_07252 [Leptomonas pyrrhocoris]
MSSGSSVSTARCDESKSTRRVRPGSFLVHFTKAVVIHVGISLGYSEDLKRVCPSAADTFPCLYKSMMEHPLWTFALHKFQDGVHVQPLGAAMDEAYDTVNCDLNDDEILALYTIAEDRGYHNTYHDHYNALNDNCQGFAGYVAKRVGNADMLKYYHDVTHAQFAHGFRAAGIASWTGALVAIAMAPAAAPLFIGAFAVAWLGTAASALT